MKIRTLISVICAAAVMTAAGTTVAYAANEAAPSSALIASNEAYTASAIVISGEDVKSAFDANGENTKAYVSFKALGSYELQFNFRLNSGVTKTYTMLSNRTKDLVAYVPMQDMLNKLKFTAADVKDLTVNGPSLNDVTGISLSLTNPTKTTTVTTSTTTAPAAPAATSESTTVTPVPAATTPAATTTTTTTTSNVTTPASSATTAPAAHGEENPATGVGTPVAILAMVSLSGAVVFGTLKLRKKMADK